MKASEIMKGRPFSPAGTTDPDGSPSVWAIGSMSVTGKRTVWALKYGSRDSWLAQTYAPGSLRRWLKDKAPSCSPVDPSTLPPIPPFVPVPDEWVAGIVNTFKACYSPAAVGRKVMELLTSRKRYAPDRRAIVDAVKRAIKLQQNAQELYASVMGYSPAMCVTEKDVVKVMLGELSPEDISL